jgi:hypothetical protein
MNKLCQMAAMTVGSFAPLVMSVPVTAKPQCPGGRQPELDRQAQLRREMFNRAERLRQGDPRNAASLPKNRRK